MQGSAERSNAVIETGEVRRRRSHLGLMQVRLLNVGGGALHNKLVLMVPIVRDVALHLRTEQQFMPMVNMPMPC